MTWGFNVSGLALFPICFAVALGCQAPVQGVAADSAGATAGDTAQDSGISLDLANSDGTAGQNDGPNDTGSASGGVWLTFEVDDSANKTFGDGDIKWTGSFTWDQKTREITPAASWLPTDGPYPPLYDDGPEPAGHERDGAVAGDHILSTKVHFTVAEDTVFEYGALNEFDNWMWLGQNGKIALTKGQSGTVAAAGLKLKAFGGVDVKIALDTSKLNAAFKWSLKTHKFFVKGTLNQWTPVQLLDDGQAGDSKADDGILTYVHKLHLGKHDGLLAAGDEVQFIFVATTGDTEPAAGQEYKGAKEAYADGVSAWAATGADGAFASVPVVTATDSKGKFKNTAFVVPSPADGCSPACAADETCTAGKCSKSDPCNNACTADEKCASGKCVAILQITAVEPSKGWVSGASAVKVIGAGFVSGTTVLFAEALAADVVTAADGKSLTCKTPANAAGLVKVKVSNPDGQSAALADGFFYQAVPVPALHLSGALSATANDKQAYVVTAVAKVPTVSNVAGQTPDLTVEFGYAPAGSDVVTNAAAWKWSAATYVDKDVAKGEENWTGTLPVLPIGSYAWLARAKWQGQTVIGDGDGSENGVTPKQYGSLAVLPKSTAPTLTGVEPPWLAAKGSSKITLLGDNLKVTFAVEVISTAKNPQKALLTNPLLTDNGLQITVGPLPLGSANATIAPPNLAVLTLVSSLAVVPWDSPALDGLFSGDWDASSTVATNSVVTAWGAGLNELKFANIAYDKDNLYFGVSGVVEAGNAIVVYFDTDYGAAPATGTKNPGDFKDVSGAVDDAISSALLNAEAKIGIDYALATIGMAGFDGKDLAKSTAAGWRNLSNTGDFGWIGAPIVCAANSIPAVPPGMEAAIPLATLYPLGIPKTGVTLKWLVVIGNKDGTAVSNQFLPMQLGQPDAKTATTWGSIQVFPAAAP